MKKNIDVRYGMVYLLFPTNNLKEVDVTQNHESNFSEIIKELLEIQVSETEEQKDNYRVADILSGENIKTVFIEMP